jgi:hypothetical protein
VANNPRSTEEKETSAVANMETALLEFKEGRPYLALIGQTFNAWGIVDVSGDSRTHIAVKNLPPEILAKTGATSAPEIVAIERKLVLAQTKGFHDIPRSDAFELLETLRDNLMTQVEEMRERGEGMFADQKIENAADAKWLRSDLKELEREYIDYWRSDLKEFRETTLPEALIEYWNRRVNAAEAELEDAKRGKQRAIARITK